MKLTISLFNSIFSFLVVGIASFYTAISIFLKKRREGKVFAFALSWLFLGFTFIFITVRLIAFSLDAMAIDENFFYLGQVAIAFVFAPLMYHAAWKLTQNKTITYLLSLAAGICAVFFLIFLFSEGIVGPKISDWGSDYSPTKRASLLFMIPYVTAFLLVVMDLVRRVFRWMKSKTLAEKGEFRATLSLFIFLSLAAVDELAIETGWILVLFRMIMMLSALLASISYASVDYE